VQEEESNKIPPIWYLLLTFLLTFFSLCATLSPCKCRLTMQVGFAKTNCAAGKGIKSTLDGGIRCSATFAVYRVADVG
jgi:hypothetical protein